MDVRAAVLPAPKDPEISRGGHTLAIVAIVGIVPVIRTDAAMHGEQGDLMRYDWGCCGTCGAA